MLAGLLLIGVILISGTFAYQQFNQGAFNPAWADEVYLIGGRVHDDFQDREGYGPYDKDIFAENFGDRDIFVRIQLREFLSINDVAIGGAVISSTSTWPLYQAEPFNATIRRAGSLSYDIGEAGIEWTLGNAANVQKIFMPTHNHATHPATNLLSVPSPFDDINAYRFSNTTGRGVEAIAGPLNIGAQNSAEDIHANGVQTGPGISDGTHEFWSLTGANSFWDAYLIYVNEAGELTRSTDYVRHYAQATLAPDYGGIMTLEQWRVDRPEGNFWIMDTENDGSWFYWNGYLPAGEATSLLLNGIYIPDRREAWQYVIYMNADFFTRDDMPEDISEAAQEIFERPSGLDIPNTPHALWTDSTGHVWRVLEPANVEGVGGLGNALLISEFAIQSSLHAQIVENSHAWFVTNGAPELHEFGMSTVIPPSRGNSTDEAFGQNTFMHPNTNTVGSALAFPLSQVEAVHHFAHVCPPNPNGDQPLPNYNGPCANRATPPLSPAAWGQGQWHTRALNVPANPNFFPIAYTVAGVAANPDNGGSIFWNSNANHATRAYGSIRPALWVQVQQ